VSGRKLRVVGLGGSLAMVSKSRAALLKALEGAEAAGAQTELLDLRELDLPMYNSDDNEPDDEVEMEEVDGHFYYLRYPLVGTGGDKGTRGQGDKGSGLRGGMSGGDGGGSKFADPEVR